MRTLGRQSLALLICVAVLLVTVIGFGWTGWVLNFAGGLFKMGAAMSAVYLFNRYALRFDPSDVPADRAELAATCRAVLMGSAMIGGALL